jgi:UDP-N-acetylglucosamine 2-epimerase (non-hydrolysing)
MKRISFIFGTRPEAIKLASIILAMKEQSDIEPHVCATGQHRQMLDQALKAFDIRPNVDLSLMEPNQTLPGYTSKAIRAIGDYLLDSQPAMVLVQGDTMTTLCASLAAFYQKIPVGYVEAGLRTWNMDSPYPEEMNRVLTTRLASYHFAPTVRAKMNLIQEGVRHENVWVTGNTAIDSLYYAVERIRQSPPTIEGIPKDLMGANARCPLILITVHRSENFGQGLQKICKAIIELANRFPHAAFVYPVHLNPNVRGSVFRYLSGWPNIHLLGPLPYLSFVALMERARIILSDSGGIQEEAPSLGKPVLVMRQSTERVEALEAGTAKLVGAETEVIVQSVSELMTDPSAIDAMRAGVNPFGDGFAADRVAHICREILKGASRWADPRRGYRTLLPATMDQIETIERVSRCPKLPGVRPVSIAKVADTQAAIDHQADTGDPV